MIDDIKKDEDIMIEPEAVDFPAVETSEIETCVADTMIPDETVLEPIPAVEEIPSTGMLVNDGTVGETPTPIAVEEVPVEPQYTIGQYFGTLQESVVNIWK